MNHHFILVSIILFYILDSKNLFAQNDFLDLNVAAKQEKIRKDGFKDHNQFNDQFDRIRQRSEAAHIEDYLKWEELRSEALLEYKREKSRKKKPVIVENESDSDANYREYLKDQEKELKAYDQTRQRYIAARQRLRGENHPLTPEKELGLDVQRPRYDYKKRALYGAPQKLGKSQNWTTSGGGSSGGSFAPPPPPPPSFPTDFGAPPPPDNFNPDMDPSQQFQDNFAPPPPPPMDPATSFPAPFPEGGDFAPPPPPMNDAFGDFPPPPPPDF